MSRHAVYRIRPHTPPHAHRIASDASILQRFDLEILDRFAHYLVHAHPPP